MNLLEFHKRPFTERLITRRVAAGYGLVSIVVIVMCAALISFIAQLSSLVHGMQTDEAAVKASSTLAASIREQYIHQAHWIIAGDNEHLEHYSEVVSRIDSEIEALVGLVPVTGRERLADVRRASLKSDRLFRERLIPARRQGNQPEVQRVHHRLEALTTVATTDADTLARAVEARMAQAHRSATRYIRLGLLTGGVCVAVVLALSVMFTLRLRRAVLRPLGRLVRAANLFGSGDFASRVGEVGEGEFQEVARAFDGMADELEVRQRQLIDGERMAAIGQLAAGVAHEINNPIAVIRGYLKTMGPQTAKDTLAEELAILDEEATACQRIAEDLVAYSRSPDIERRSTDIAALLRETIRRFGETPEGRAHQIREHIDDTEIEIDGPRIRQVILNLLLNAAQVSPPQSPIELRTCLNGEHYQLEVSDRGPGVLAENKDRIFEPFFSKRAGGSGLGLAVCSGIIRAHQGTIVALDREGGGTTMRIKLPISAALAIRSSKELASD